jgi:glucose-6-phosphate isomerase, archaeal
MQEPYPFQFAIPLPTAVPSYYDAHLERRLSDLKGMFLDQPAYASMVEQDDPLIYEVYEVHRPEVAGELLMGLSIVHPGRVGQEFFMTKGHFHTILETAEVYYVLKGEGFMVMETPEGESRIEPLSPGSVLYVPPRWAHRSVCTSRQQDLATFFIYPANAGHNYGTIEQQGFRKLVVESQTGIEFIDNPHWKK